MAKAEGIFLLGKVYAFTPNGADPQKKKKVNYTDVIWR